MVTKLAGVALWGAWKWRREQRRLERETRAREIEADYEVLDGPERGALNSARKQGKE